MKKLISLFACIVFLNSCAVVISSRIPAPAHDNGKHKGWYKNRHNPHNPASDNPGHRKKFAPVLPAVDNKMQSVKFFQRVSSCCVIR